VGEREGSGCAKQATGWGYPNYKQARRNLFTFFEKNKLYLLNVPASSLEKARRALTQTEQLTRDGLFLYSLEAPPTGIPRQV